MPGYRFYLWFSRIGGLIILLFFLSFFIGEGLPDIRNGKGNELLQFLPFAGISVIGFVIGWFRPYGGGLTMIIGAVILASFFLWKDDLRMALLFGLPSLMIGLTFVAAARKELI